MFLIANTAIEIIIVRRLRRELADKMANIASMHASSRILNEKRAKSDAKKKQKAIVMVIINSLINLVLRFPEFFLFLKNSNILFNNNPLFNILCGDYAVCDYMIEMSNFFFILTFSTNYLTYYFFNKKFRKCIKAR